MALEVRVDRVESDMYGEGHIELVIIKDGREACTIEVQEFTVEAYTTQAHREVRVVVLAKEWGRHEMRVA